MWGNTMKGRRPSTHRNQKTAVVGALERGRRICAVVAPASLTNINALAAHIFPGGGRYSRTRRGCTASSRRRATQHHRINYLEKVVNVSGEYPHEHDRRVLVADQKMGFAPHTTSCPLSTLRAT